MVLKFNPDQGSFYEAPDEEVTPRELPPPSPEITASHIAQQRANLDQSQFYSQDYTPQVIDPGASTEDTIFRLISDRLSGARARYNQLGKSTGATQQDLLAALQPLQGQLGEIDSQRNLLSGLTQRLTSSAVGSTAGASIAAVNAARLSGDGRYGAGGNAAVAASRGAVDAAVGQSAALSQAIVQGQLGEANFQSGLLQQRGGVTAALSQLLQQQAGLKEDRGKLGVASDTEAAQILSAGLQVYGGIRESRQQKDPKAKAPSIFGLI